jgi:methionyl-tRNA formyltransferase
MKIGFFGTPELAAAVLADAIAAQDVEVAYVVSQPDRPVGRHATLMPSPVSQLALSHHITLFRPEKIRGNSDFLTKLQDFEVDFLVVVAYGKILPAEILALPKVLPINVHASLLPKYRGASPIQ